jgi:trimethyllysine dioxygenase
MLKRGFTRACIIWARKRGYATSGNGPIPATPPQVKRTDANTKSTRRPTLDLSRTAQHRITTCQPDFSSRRLVIQWEDGKRQDFDFFWLRDNAPAEVHSASSQRLTPTENIPLDDIRPLAASINSDGHIDISWSDSSRSCFSNIWLRQNAERGSSGDALLAPPDETTSILWNGTSFGTFSQFITEQKHNLPGVQFESLMSTSDTTALENMLDQIYLYGFSIVWDTPLTPEASRAACERLGYCRATMFGDFWDLTVDSDKKEADFSDTAYTPLSIAPHTDGTYLHDPPGLQSFHILHHNGQGGLNSLVDGWKVAENIREHERQLTHSGSDLRPWKTLTEKPFEFYYTDNNVSIRYKSPVVHLNEAGRIRHFRWNNHDRLPPHPNTSSQDLRQYHYASQIVQRQIMAPENQVLIKLNPGMLLVTNGWRVLHGRTAMSGSRRLVGCYINYDDFLSRRRVLKRREGDILQLY